MLVLPIIKLSYCHVYCDYGRNGNVRDIQIVAYLEKHARKTRYSLHLHPLVPFDLTFASILQDSRWSSDEGGFH